MPILSFSLSIDVISGFNSVWLSFRPCTYKYVFIDDKMEGSFRNCVWLLHSAHDFENPAWLYDLYLFKTWRYYIPSKIAFIFFLCVRCLELGGISHNTLYMVRKDLNSICLCFIKFLVLCIRVVIRLNALYNYTRAHVKKWGEKNEKLEGKKVTIDIDHYNTH